MCEWGQTKTIKIKTPNGYKTIVADKCLASLLKSLNAKGFYTLGHCCGHGKNQPEIIFRNENGRILHENIEVKTGYFEIFSTKT